MTVGTGEDLTFITNSETGELIAIILHTFPASLTYLYLKGALLAIL